MTQSSCRWPTPVDSDFRLYELLKNDSRLLESLATTTWCGRSRQHSGGEVCGDWWRMTGSNRRPPACKAGALPAELIPPGSSQLTHQARVSDHSVTIGRILVGLVGLEPTTPALSRRCSNQLSYRPMSKQIDFIQQPISVGVQIELLFPERR